MLGRRRVRSRGGLGGIILLIGVLYFTDAGSWLWARVKQLDEQCYAAMARVSASVAGPVCGAAAKTISALEQVSMTVDGMIGSIKQNFVGSTNVDQLNTLAHDLQRRASSLASSKDELARLISGGPYSLGGGTDVQQFQAAMDGFAIGQSYMKSNTTKQLAVPWLQRSAQQPQGYGVMSQLTLGNMYAQGDGVPADRQVAQAYLEQAQRSLELLSVNKTAQAKQLLGSLPGSPKSLQQDIKTAIIKLQAGQ